MTIGSPISGMFPSYGGVAADAGTKIGVLRNVGGYEYVEVDFRWYGDQVDNDVDESIVVAMNTVLDDAVERAIPLARIDTGDLRHSIKVWGVFLMNQTEIWGVFGSDLHYALFQELGTRHHTGTFYLTLAGNEATQRLIPEVRKELAARGYGAVW